MTLPMRRKKQKMGVREPERRVFLTHRQYVRRHSCCVPGCEDGPIRFHHVKTRGAGGGDETGVSLCETHHVLIHTIGIETFQARFGIDLWALAAEFARKTTDKAMREAMKEPAT